MCARLGLDDCLCIRRLAITVSGLILFATINLFEKHNNGVANCCPRWYFINQLQLGSGTTSLG